ncbi:MAG: electron transfer flavoprotein subunit beta, partial [Acidobacteria bacterium]|nr:electron transfer flavoprotein subunit beta [Acidobacteriota bacterium]
INQIRYATLKGIMAAKKKEIARADSASLGIAGGGKIRIERIAFPKSDKTSEIIGGSPKEAAATLVQKMKKEMKIL